MGFQGFSQGNRPLCVFLSGPARSVPGVQPLDADGSQLPTVGEEPAEEVEHFHGVPPVSESRASADVPVPEDADLDDMINRLPDELFKRPLEEVLGASGAQSSTSRSHLEPPPTLERKRETSEVSEAASRLRQSFSGFPQSSVLWTIPCVCLTCVCQPSRQSSRLRFLGCSKSGRG